MLSNDSNFGTYIIFNFDSSHPCKKATKSREWLRSVLSASFLNWLLYNHMPNQNECRITYVNLPFTSREVGIKVLINRVVLIHHALKNLSVRNTLRTIKLYFNASKINLYRWLLFYKYKHLRRMQNPLIL